MHFPVTSSFFLALILTGLAGHRRRRQDGGQGLGQDPGQPPGRLQRRVQRPRPLPRLRRAKADAEGYGAVASLFRAAARAEEIHAGNHAEVIRHMGAEPKADDRGARGRVHRREPQGRDRGRVLRARHHVPRVPRAARAERNQDALQTFNYAKTAEAEHAKLYAEALADLESLDGSEGRDLLGVLGVRLHHHHPRLQKCPSCFESKDNYVRWR